MSSKSKNDRLAEWRDQIAHLLQMGASLDDLARNSVKHFDEQSNNPLRKAADCLGLDASKRAHRDLLSHILAEVWFRPPGRSPWAHDWTAGRYMLLGQHYAEVIRDCPDLSDTKAAALIRAKFPEYKTFQADVIRKRLPRARIAYGRIKAGE